MNWTAQEKQLLELYARAAGKIETAVHVPIRRAEDMAVWYTPGVAVPCRAIQAEPDRVWELTNRANTIAIVSDGTRILGLGDIGPRAGLPVMEAKAMLFKLLGGVDAYPIVLDTRDADELVRTVLLLQPGLGGVNLEDIAQPKCFRVLGELRARAEIPIWHDDQQGTAAATVAGLINALRVVGKRPDEVTVAYIGAGAANVAGTRLAFAAGVRPELTRVVDSHGILGRHRHDIDATAFPDKWRLCQSTNADGRQGGIAEALAEADVCVALSRSGPGVIRPEWVAAMRPSAIVFACANPQPEIAPELARSAGAAVVATGASGTHNQLNNSLIFPGVFRGALDVRARTISDEMCLSAARVLADAVGPRLSADCILPTMEEWSVVVDIAVAVGGVAIQQGLARRTVEPAILRTEAERRIRRAREMLRLFTEAGLTSLPAETMP